MKKLRTAVVGVGYLGTFHAQKIKNNPQAELVAVCDPMAAQAEKVGQDLQVPFFTDYTKLIGSIDAVSIASTTQTHFEISEFFLKNNIHVNVEKPIAAESPQAHKLVKLAAENNLVFSVGHIERFNPTILELKKRIQKPKAIELIRHAPFRRRGADVSVVHDLMIHDLDLMLWLGHVKAEEIVKLSSTAVKVISQTYDASTAHFTFQNGLQVYLTISRSSPAIERKIKVYDQDRILVANTGEGFIEIAHNKNPGSSEILEDNFVVEKIMIEKQDALQSELNEFVAHVQAHRAGQAFQGSAATGLEGLMALALVDKVIGALS